MTPLTIPEAKELLLARLAVTARDEQYGLTRRIISALETLSTELDFDFQQNRRRHRIQEWRRDLGTHRPQYWHDVTSFLVDILEAVEVSP